MARYQRPKARLALVAVLIATPAFAGSTEPPSPEVQKYCGNIAVAASDARFAWQTGKLDELERRIKARIIDLDAKAAELRGLIEKRDALDKKAKDKLVGIYGKMRPETAATQISTLDDEMAAAVLSQLTPRQASAIFNEFAPERAARLAGVIAGVTPATDEKKL